MLILLALLAIRKLLMLLDYSPMILASVLGHTLRASLV